MTYQLSACVEMLFAAEIPVFADRIRAAADAGLPAVEFWSWRDKDIAAIHAALEQTGLALTSFVSDSPGQLVDPATHPQFRHDLRESCARAVDLGATRLVVLSGLNRPGVDPAEQTVALASALSDAAIIAAEYGITLILEPLNTVVDHPGNFLSRTEQGLAIIRAVNHPALALLYDLYHSVAMGEVPQAVLAGNMHMVGHVQIADAPGRHEPGTGTIDWAAQLNTLSQLGYQGLIGLEYKPSASTESSLRRLSNYL